MEIVTPENAAPEVPPTPAAPSLRATLLRQATHYSLGTFLAMFAAIARAGVGAHYLPAAQVGTWLALQVFVGYATNLHFGTVFGMFRSVPIKLALGDVEGAAAEARTTFTFVLGMTAVVSVVALGVGPLLYPEVGWTFLLEGVAFTALSLLKTVYVGIFKAERRFGELSVSTALSGAVALGGVAAIPRFGLHGLLGGMIVQNAAEIGILMLRRRLPGLGISRSVLKDQLRVGLMTLLINVGVTAIMTFERTVMLSVLGLAATGMFVIGAQILHLVPAVASIPAGVLTPVVFERVGRGEPLLPLVDKPVLVLSYGLAWMTMAGTLAIAPVIALLWPHLEPGNTAAKVALLSAIPIALAGPVSNIYYAVNRQAPLVAILIVSSALTYVGSRVGVHLTHSIAGAAGGATVAIYMYYVASLVGAFRLVDASARDALLLAARSLAPVLYGVVIVTLWDLAMNRVLPASSLLRGVLAQVFLLVAMTPWLLRAVAMVRGRA
jgi:O-antigen/teichoic acid export membrane protein